MPYQKISEANPAIRGIKPPVTLSQANMIAGWADSIEERGEMDSPWAGAIALFKRTHHVEDGKWVKNKGSTAEHSDEPSREEMEEALDALVKALLEAGFEVITSEDLEDDLFAGEPAYVVDLFTELPQTADGRPDFRQPFRILPTGTIHRYGKRTVTVDDIDEFADNWLHRATKGIRRKRIVVDAEHETGGIGWYTDVFSRGAEGLWAKIALSANGRKLLDQRDFYFFSPTVAWQSKDRVTGEVVRNQIVGGALTNFPVFGDDTALPTMGYSEAALQRLRDLYHDTDQMSSIEYLFQKGGPMTAEFTTEDRTMLQQIADMLGGLISKRGGDHTVPDNDKDKTIEVTAQQFAELQGKLTTLTEEVQTLSAERDALKTQVTEGQTKLAAETYTRVLGEMRQHAETFTHLALPLELAKDAPEGTLTAQEHLAWLQAADGTDDQKHWNFFNEVLRAANAALAEAAQFTEFGASSSADLSEDQLLDQKARKYAAEHKVPYMTALKAVMGGAELATAA